MPDFSFDLCIRHELLIKKPLVCGNISAVKNFHICGLFVDLGSLGNSIDWHSNSTEWER